MQLKKIILLQLGLPFKVKIIKLKNLFKKYWDTSTFQLIQVKKMIILDETGYLVGPPLHFMFQSIWHEFHKLFTK